MKKSIAVLFLGCMSSLAWADAADQATLKVYKQDGSLVLQKAELIEPAEVGAVSTQSFDLDGAKYTYSANYAPAADYEASSVQLTVDDGAKTTSDTVTLQPGKVITVKRGAYVLAFSMDPAVD
jgi:hypothetical protein